MHTFGETSGGVPAFLAKLWRLVEDSDTNHLIYWSKDGRSFIIQNQAQFARELLPLNYKHNNMASFIRQLNMYGFHKITSIENGGLKFDRDEMEFSHPCFKRGHPYLLEHIKRKIANPKGVIDEKAALKPETVSKVLNEVKAMRGRQDSLDSRFSAIKQENEALWREIAVLRQKHLKQQQIVNKLIQFLVTIVQPSRNMGGVKRHFQLMINDVPQSSKMRKTSEHDSGPVIRELGEELLDEVNDSDSELLISSSPNVLSPGSSIANQAGFEDNINSPQSNVERPKSSASSVFSQVNESNLDDGLVMATSSTGQNSQRSEIQSGDSSYVIYQMDDDADKKSNNQLAEEHILNTPLVERELAGKQVRGRKRKWQETEQQQEDSPSMQNQMQTKNVNNSMTIKTENDLDPLMFFDVSQDSSSQRDGTPSTCLISPIAASDETNRENSQENQTNDDRCMYTSKEDFISNEIPNDLFEDPSILDNDLDVASGSYNTNFNLKSKPFACTASTLEPNTSDSSSLAVTKYNSTKQPNRDEILRLNSVEDLNNHLDGLQGDLDSLKELLRGEGYTLDANTLLGNSPQTNRLILSPSVDGDLLSKLFSDSDILAPYGLSISNEGQLNQDNNKRGSELMTYQPYYADLSDILGINETLPAESSDGVNKSHAAEESTLNTPRPERD